MSDDKLKELYEKFKEEYEQDDHKFYRACKRGDDFWDDKFNLEARLMFYAGYMIAKGEYEL